MPDTPAVVGQSMLGAAGNQAPNYPYNVAAKDGTVIGLPLQDLIFNARIGVQAVKYDSARAHYLGGADVTRPTLSVMKASGIRTPADPPKHEHLLLSTPTSPPPSLLP